jgi:hypothetical protein
MVPIGKVGRVSILILSTFECERQHTLFFVGIHNVLLV